MSANCKSYNDFKEVHRKRREIYMALNPLKGPICGPEGCPYPTKNPSEIPKVPMEFMRGAIVAIMATWEAYVRDILEEAFDEVVTTGRGRGSERMNWREPDEDEEVRCSTRLSGSTVLQTIVKSDFEAELLGGRADEVKKQASELAVKMLQNPQDYIKRSLDEHKQGEGYPNFLW